MSKSTRFSARASLAAVGRWMRQKGIWEAVEKHVHIKQKVVKHKLLDAPINVPAGGHGLVGVNTRLRP
jgi:hypothetical protein